MLGRRNSGRATRPEASRPGSPQPTSDAKVQQNDLDRHFAGREVLHPVRDRRLDCSLHRSIAVARDRVEVAGDRELAN